MNPASKKFPALSLAKAEDRFEHVEWLMDHLDYTDEECDKLSLKEMRKLRKDHEMEMELNGEM